MGVHSHKMDQGLDERGSVVERWDVVKRAATGALERLLALDGDLFQRLEAVGDKAGAHHVDAARPRAAQLLQHRGGVRTQPLGPAEARLKRDRIVAGLQSERLRKQSTGLLALAVVGIAEFERSPRHTVEAHDELASLVDDTTELAP